MTTDIPDTSKESKELVLPEIKLTETFKSEKFAGTERLSSSDQGGLVEYTFYYGEYTLISVSGIRQMIILDKLGRVVNDIRLIKSQLQYASAEKDTENVLYMMDLSNGDIMLKMKSGNTQTISTRYDEPRAWVMYSSESGNSKDHSGSKFGCSLPNNLKAFVVREEELRIVDNSNRACFVDPVRSIRTNLCTDPKNPAVLYYCASADARQLYRLDTSAPQPWKANAVDFPDILGSVNDLKLDPTGSYFVFIDKSADPPKLAFLDRDTLKVVKSIPGYQSVHFDIMGRLCAVDMESRLVYFNTNFKEISKVKEEQRAHRLLEGIEVPDPFAVSSIKASDTSTKRQEHLIGKRGDFEKEYRNHINAATTLADIEKIKKGFTQFTNQLQARLSADEVAFVVEGIGEMLAEKERAVIHGEMEKIVASVRTRLAGDLSMASIGELTGDLDTVEGFIGAMDEAHRDDLRAAKEELHRTVTDFFEREGAKIEHDLQGMIERVRSDLEGFQTKEEFDDWIEYTVPAIKSNLGRRARDCPLAASDLQKKILEARRAILALEKQYQEKFEKAYAQIREQAAEAQGQMIGVLEEDIAALFQRIRDKAFKRRGDVETFVEHSEAKKAIDAEIDMLGNKNPQRAKELKRQLKVELMNIIAESERRKDETIGEAGQQLVMFGSTAFPKWEAKVKHRRQKNVELIFLADERTKGPGITADKIVGDVAVRITDPEGNVTVQRLFEGRSSESELRYGVYGFKLGAPITPSYVTRGDFTKIQKAYKEWMRGKDGALQSELQRLQAELGKSIDPETKKSLREKYEQFLSENYIVMMKRLERIRAVPSEKSTNGRGLVPEWSTHWVVAPEDEATLEEMAQDFLMQLHNKEGIMNLVGHAGTGKDVSIKIFAHRTNRPLFAIDCSKWTTEFELSEDIIIEAEGGASKTVKVPSIVLNAIQTPGAIMYFNEINAMPEQAQIFLHALFDEKRTLTLKTSSGKTIKADPTVLFASSMNPDYPGTFKPQMATRSRMVDLHIGYPPLLRKKDDTDANPNPPYSASEALKIARSIDSFFDETLDPDMTTNEFVKIWDRYINQIQNGAPELTPEQKFDLEAILALVYFSNNLRAEFIKIFEKTDDSHNALPVTQPITLREVRRAAFFISRMPTVQKATANPEAIARQLIERFFLTHIDNQEDRQKIKTAMATWSAPKRVVA